MIGDSLHQFAGRILRGETCRRIVEPAIADLQHEAARSTLWRLRGYTAVWLALGGALAGELSVDASHALRALATPAAVKPALLMLALLSTGLMLPFAWRLETFHAPAWLLIPLLIPSALPVAALPALAVAARVAAREPHSTRGFAVVAAIAAALLLVYTDQGVTRTNRMFRDIEGRAQGIESPAPGARELSLIELRRYDPTTHWGRGHQQEFVREGPQRIGFAASAIAYVLIGVALARVRRWAVAMLLVATSVLHYALMLGAFLVSIRQPELTAAFCMAPAVALIAAASVATKGRNHRVWR
jgi:hypothetical protein